MRGLWPLLLVVIGVITALPVLMVVQGIRFSGVLATAALDAETAMGAGDNAVRVLD
jgi:hypothetical protein